MSDIGGDGLAFSNNATFTLADTGGAFPASGNIPTGTYAPTNISAGNPDTFPSGAPTPSSQTTFSGAFSGISPNGTWKLYIVDDTTGDVGQMAGGWSLSVTTTVSAAATTTSLQSSANPSTTGSPVVFTATVTSGGNPVTAGTVDFKDGNTTLASGVALDGNGQAALSTSALAEGTHDLSAVYSGTADFLTSNGHVSQVVDNQTAVDGTTYCNTGVITIPTQGTATPYGSHVHVSGLPGAPLAVMASVTGLAHAVPEDIDMMLVGPGGQTVELMSDVGGSSAVSGINLVFADGSPAMSTTSLTSGTYAPTDNTVDGPDTFPAPAPTPTGATAMSTFAGVAANGTWSLYVVDDASGDSGSISGGWCVSFTVQSPTGTTLGESPRTTVSGALVTFTANVTSGGSPVTAGTVAFVDVTHGAHTILASGVPLSGSGTAQYSTSALSAGRHIVQAEYSGTSTLAGSTSPRAIARIKPIADAGGPYTIAASDSLTLDATASSIDGTTKITWDINGDGHFGDAVGANPTLTWSQLQALDIQSGHVYPVVVKVTTGGVPNRSKTTLTVTP